MRGVQRELLPRDSDELATIGMRVRAGVDALEERRALDRRDARARIRVPVLAGAGPFLELAGTVCGGAQLARAALVAAGKLAAGDGDAAISCARRSRPRAISPTTA